MWAGMLHTCIYAASACCARWQQQQQLTVPAAASLPLLPYWALLGVLPPPAFTAASCKPHRCCRCCHLLPHRGFSSPGNTGTSQEMKEVGSPEDVRMNAEGAGEGAQSRGPTRSMHACMNE